MSTISGRVLRRAQEEERGQALVEFALVVPIFLLLLLGIVEFARAWNVYEVLTDAAREGAREAVVANPTTTRATIVDVIQEAGARASINIDDADIYVDVDGVDGVFGNKGDPATVRIEYEHELRWVGALMALFADDRTVTMITEFTMRMEDSRSPPTT